MGIAFLKGHIGMVDFLLSQPGVDINFKNDEGEIALIVLSLDGLFATNKVVYDIFVKILIVNIKKKIMEKKTTSPCLFILGGSEKQTRFLHKIYVVVWLPILVDSRNI